MMSFKNSNLAQAWLVLLMATFFGTMLAGIQMKLNPVIEANKTKETMQKIPELVPIGSTEPLDIIVQSRVIEVKKNGITKFYPMYDVLKKDGSLTGHVAKAKGQGYADKIEVLIGLDAEGQKITGLFILDQKETPGLGSRIVEKPWQDQFLNKSTDKALVVVKSGADKGNEIDGISGATISSRSVANIINTTIADIHPRLISAPEETKESK